MDDDALLGEVPDDPRVAREVRQQSGNGALRHDRVLAEHAFIVGVRTFETAAPSLDYLDMSASWRARRVAGLGRWFLARGNGIRAGVGMAEGPLIDIFQPRARMLGDPLEPVELFVATAEDGIAPRLPSLDRLVKDALNLRL